MDYSHKLETHQVFDRGLPSANRAEGSGEEEGGRTEADLEKDEPVVRKMVRVVYGHSSLGPKYLYVAIPEGQPVESALDDVAPHAQPELVDQAMNTMPLGLGEGGD